MFLQESKPSPDRFDVKKNLIATGEALAMWGSLPPTDFEEEVRLKLHAKLIGEIERLEKCLSRYKGQPQYWADDLTACLGAMEKALERPELFMPYDLADAFGKDAAFTLMQRLVRRFGELIQAWPDLREASQSLHSRGVQLARPL